MPPKKTVQSTDAKWQILCPSHKLHLHATLGSGQTFRWHPLQIGGENTPVPGTSLSIDDDTSKRIWRGVVEDQCYELKEQDGHILVRNGAPSSEKSTPFSLEPLKASLQLEEDFSSIVATWRKALTTKEKEKLSETARGLRLMMNAVLASDPNRVLARVRLVKTAPIEMIFCFICSSNNQLSRITSMINCLCENFGNKIGNTYSFPTAKSIADNATEGQLKEAKFGYRAGYIISSANAISKGKDGEQKFIERLRTADLDSARQQLMELRGVGRKVADCILCYMFHPASSAVAPMDTHLIALTERAKLVGAAGKLALDESSSSDDDDDDDDSSDDDQKKKKRKSKKASYRPKDHDSAQAAFVEAFGSKFAGYAQLLFFVSKVNNGFFVTAAAAGANAAQKEGGKRRQRE